MQNEITCQFFFFCKFRVQFLPIIDITVFPKLLNHSTLRQLFCIANFQTYCLNMQMRHFKTVAILLTVYLCNDCKYEFGLKLFKSLLIHSEKVIHAVL